MVVFRLSIIITSITLNLCPVACLCHFVQYGSFKCFYSLFLLFFFLTETWLKPGEQSHLVEVCPPDYDYYSSPQPSGRGGGLAVICRNYHKCTPISSNIFSSFEVLMLKSGGPTPVLCVAVYRPQSPPKVFEFSLSIVVKYDYENFNLCWPFMLTFYLTSNLLSDIKPNFSVPWTVLWFYKNSHSPKVLLETINRALSLSVISCPEPITNDFLHFFTNKIANIQSAISPPAYDPPAFPPCPAVLSEFEPVSFTQLKDFVLHTKMSTYPFDILPTRLLREVFNTVGSTIFFILNSSLANGSVPPSLKHAVLQPILKKPNLNASVLNNF